jgi:uncharacterized SAM-dependent methyltransferase
MRNSGEGGKLERAGNAVLGQFPENKEKIIASTEKSMEERLCESLRSRELPDYLLYMGTGGAKNWLKLNAAETFPVARRLKDLLEENIASIVRFIPSCMSLVSVGVGSGEKEKILLEALIKKSLDEKPASGRVPIRYYPIDINTRLVDIALEKVRDLPVEKKGIVGFIEDMPRLKEHWHLPVLFCILGNTFCNYEPEFLLQLVYENLEQGDLFFFDASLLPESGSGEEAHAARKSVLGTYASRENALFNMYPLLQYGMDPEDFDFELLLSHVDSKVGALCRTRKSLNILKDTEINIGSETVSFRDGDVIRMGFTYKYTYDQITALLDINRFDVLRVFRSKDGENVIFLAKKRI